MSNGGGDAPRRRLTWSHPSGVVQLVEHRPLEPAVAGSSPAPRARTHLHAILIDPWWPAIGWLIQAPLTQAGEIWWGDPKLHVIA